MAAYPKAQYEATRARPGVARAGFIVLGITLVAVGTISLLFPLLAAFSLNIAAGITLLVGGFATLFHALRMRRWRGFALQLLLGLVYLGGGIIFILDPFAGLIALTVMLGALFAADGTARIMLGLRIRPQTGWWLFALTGVLSLMLGVAVLLGLQGGWSVAFLGVFVGVNMIVTGVSFLCCTGSDPARGRGRAAA